jgi:TatD DNase family protein
MLIDTHCHLTHERLWGDLDRVLADGGRAGVGAVVAVASDLDDAREISKICQGGRGSHPTEPRVWGTAGIHPHEASAAPAALREQLLDIVRSHPQVVALGECGLDYHYDLSPRDVQRRTFDAHIEVGQETGLPLVVHCRDAETDMKSSTAAAKAAGFRGVLHC